MIPEFKDCRYRIKVESIAQVEHTSEALKHSQLEEAKAKSGLQQAVPAAL